jgi:hypothetical protein
MFWIDRSIYAVDPATVQETARRVRAAGGRPFLITNRSVPLTPLSPAFLDGLRVYMLPDSALQQSP